MNKKLQTLLSRPLSIKQIAKHSLSLGLIMGLMNLLYGYKIFIAMVENGINFALFFAILTFLLMATMFYGGIFLVVLFFSTRIAKYLSSKIRSIKLVLGISATFGIVLFFSLITLFVVVSDSPVVLHR